MLQTFFDNIMVSSEELKKVQSVFYLIRTLTLISFM